MNHLLAGLNVDIAAFEYRPNSRDIIQLECDAWFLDKRES